MLPKATRLSTREFDLVARTGQVSFVPTLNIKHIPSDKLKISVSTPKKTFKTAVSRNRTRRRVYAAARTVVRQSKVRPSMIIITVKADVSDKSGLGLADTVSNLFVRSGLIA